jgi:hypothetical protein
MSDKLFPFLSTLEQLPPEDIDVMGNGVADHLLSGMRDGGFERGLLSGDAAQLEEMRAALLEAVRKGFIDKVGRTISENPRVSEEIARLRNPYALGVVNEANSLGFKSHLVVASDPRLVTYDSAEAWDRQGYKDVRPYLVQMPEDRSLRTPNEKLWIPGVTRWKDTPGSGAGDRYSPGYTTSYANVMDSTTRAVSEIQTNEPSAFVNTVLVPLATIKAFRPDAQPARYVPSGRSTGSH